jgi:methanogenic corrinoid protein MtbC1
VYSAADVERLQLLVAATSAGYNIGQIAALSSEELRRIVEDDHQSSSRDRSEPTRTSAAAERSGYVQRCMEAIKLLDLQLFESELRRAAAAMGHTGLMQKVVSPLLEQIGESWRAGDLRAAQEHMASAVIRTMLGSLAADFEPAESAARLIVTTPIGHLHEFGALLAENAATADGWRVTYLGPNLPASEIAGAALDAGAQAVALSLIYPPNDARVSADLKELRKLLGGSIPIFAGGRASASYSEVLLGIAAVRVDDLASFRSELDRIR